MRVRRFIKITSRSTFNLFVLFVFTTPHFCSGEFGVVTLYLPIDAKGGPKALEGATPAEYTKRSFRLRLFEEELGKIRRQLEKGVGQDSGVGAGVSSEWAPPPESRIEYDADKLHIYLRPKRK